MIQPSYSLADREIEKELLPLCRAEQVAAITYSPLAAGFLTGKYSPDRAAFPKGSHFDIIPGHADLYFTERNFRLVERLRQLERGDGRADDPVGPGLGAAEPRRLLDPDRRPDDGPYR